MGRPSLTKKDYERLAEDRNLTHTGAHPYTIFQKTEWVCNLCGKKMTKSYHAVKISPTGCRCQSKNTFSIKEYHKLASKLNLEYIGGQVPNSITVTTWRTKSNEVIRASYYDLKHKLTKKMKARLES